MKEKKTYPLLWGIAVIIIDIIAVAFGWKGHGLLSSPETAPFVVNVFLLMFLQLLIGFVLSLLYFVTSMVGKELVREIKNLSKKSK